MYTLNLHNVICQLYLNKAKKKPYYLRVITVEMQIVNFFSYVTQAKDLSNKFNTYLLSASYIVC